MTYIRRSAIDQDCGVHAATGLRMTEYRDIVTDLSAHAERDYTDLGAEDQAWWDRVVDEIHQLDVAIASLPAELRSQAAMVLDDIDCDLEDHAVIVRQALVKAGIELEWHVTRYAPPDQEEG